MQNTHIRPVTDLLLGLGNTTKVCYEQPRSCVTPVYNVDKQLSSRRNPSQSTLPRPLTSHRISTWSTTSSPLSRISFKSSKNTQRRPTIGAPSDFRKVQSGRISPVRKGPTFRPLQLSIYLPGNELPDLPVFWEDGAKIRQKEIPGLERPAQALVKSKSDPMLLRRPSSTFSIPRKPVASRSSSITLDASRFSMESNLTANTLSALNDFPKPPKSKSMDQPRPERRSSIATSRSTQEFLDALDARLPQPPPIALRSNSEPAYPIYRRASDQNLRLRSHLEERQSLEKRLPDLMEEVSPLSVERKLPLSPILDHDSTFESEFVAEKPSSPAHQWFQSPVHAQETSTHRPKSSSGSSTLLNASTLNLDPFQPDAKSRADTPNSLRNRFSQWLLKALPSLPPLELDTPYQRRSSSMTSYSASAPTAHTKQSSTSSYWAYGDGSSMDIEKALSPRVTSVGVAF